MHRVTLAALALAVLVVAPSPPARGQAGGDAATVAGAVQSFYERTRSLRARFEQSYYHRIYDRYERSSGRVVFQKGGKMRWDYDEPNGKIIVADGERLVVFEPGEDGEPPQAIERPMSAHQLPQAFSFLTGSGELGRDFTFRLLDSERHGFPGGHVLELRGRTPSPHYERILFYVAARGGRSLGVVKRVLVVDEAGNRNRFDFSDVDFDVSPPASTFRLRTPSNTRWVRP